jgi:hypothetical protein
MERIYHTFLCGAILFSGADGDTREAGTHSLMAEGAVHLSRVTESLVTGEEDTSALGTLTELLHLHTPQSN